MPNAASYATPRLDLAEAFAEFDPSKERFIAHEVLPFLMVGRKDATFSKITREKLLREENVKRSFRGTYSRGDYDTEDASYSCQEYGFETPLDDSEREFYANDFDAELWATLNAIRKVLAAYEVRVSSAVFNTSTWTGSSLTTAVSTKWSSASATPIADVIAAKEKVRSLTGIVPNTLIVSQQVLNNLRSVTEIIDSVKYVQIASEGNILNALADLFGLEKILVGRAVKNTADEGQTYSGSDIWSNAYATVCVTANEGDDLRTPSVGRTFAWDQELPAGFKFAVDEYREEQTRSWVYRVRQYVDELIFDASFGHLLSNIT